MLGYTAIYGIEDQYSRKTFFFKIGFIQVKPILVCEKITIIDSIEKYITDIKLIFYRHNPFSSAKNFLRYLVKPARTFGAEIKKSIVEAKCKEGKTTSQKDVREQTRYNYFLLN